MAVDSAINVCNVVSVPLVVQTNLISAVHFNQPFKVEDRTLLVYNDELKRVRVLVWGCVLPVALRTPCNDAPASFCAYHVAPGSLRSGIVDAGRDNTHLRAHLRAPIFDRLLVAIDQVVRWRPPQALERVVRNPPRRVVGRDLDTYDALSLQFTLPGVQEFVRDYSRAPLAPTKFEYNRLLAIEDQNLVNFINYCSVQLYSEWPVPPAEFVAKQVSNARKLVNIVLNPLKDLNNSIGEITDCPAMEAILNSHPLPPGFYVPHKSAPELPDFGLWDSKGIRDTPLDAWLQITGSASPAVLRLSIVPENRTSSSARSHLELRGEGGLEAESSKQKRAGKEVVASLAGDQTEDKAEGLLAPPLKRAISRDVDGRRPPGGFSIALQSVTD
ncbi:hypothetical protein R3P38DRAFT_3219413 [Favolaschia claudopus]|uniref:Uncharacterized protein n=1 Tax=Favolaschia claudopus TaxID=2862362 RepID=A0AAW0A306_9AGAR